MVLAAVTLYCLRVAMLACNILASYPLIFPVFSAFFLYLQIKEIYLSRNNTQDYANQSLAANYSYHVISYRS
jgi:hypothetical protein